MTAELRSVTSLCGNWHVEVAFDYCIARLLENFKQILILITQVKIPKILYMYRTSTTTCN